MLEELVRYKNLKRSGIANSWPQLRRMIENEGFPPGFLLSPNVRAWKISEIDQWLAARPVEPSQDTMDRTAKSVRARQAKAAAIATTTIPAAT